MTEPTRQEKLAQAARHATVLDDKAEAGARVYAEALLNVAGAEADAVLGELDAVVSEVVDAHPDFAAVVTSPTVPTVERDRIIERVLGGHVRPTVLNFLRVLNRHGRLELLRAAAQLAREIWDRRQNRRAVSVRTAAALDEGQQTALAGKLAAMLGATPILRVETDPSLLGGMVIQIGDQVYDSSVRSGLERLRRELAGDRLQARRATLAAAATSE